MFCGNCYTMCPAMPLADDVGDGIVIMAGGKVSNRIICTEVLEGRCGVSPQRGTTLAIDHRHHQKDR